MPLLVLVAGASLWELVGDLREFAGDEELRKNVHPLWFHAAGYLRTGSRIALLIGALTARSPLALRVCWLVALALYTLPALVPDTWMFRAEVFANPDPKVQGLLAAAGPALALGAYLDLAPLAPSLCVGLSRAGLRVARLEPAARGTATLAVMFASLLLVAVVSGIVGFAMPLVNERTLLAGLALVILHYALATVLSAMLLARPERQGPRHLLTLSAATLLLAGLALFLWGLQHVEVLGQHLVKWGTTEGILSPLAALAHAIEFAGRSAVTAVALADLLMLASAREGSSA